MNTLRLGAAPLAMGLALCAGTAHAQQAAAAGDQAAAGETIVVTGTRIRLPNLTSFEPTVTIGREYLQDRGLTNVADALNESPGVRGSTTPQGLQPSLGLGMNFANLYGLGVNRTLVLVNGKRQVSSLIPQLNSTPGTPVDLNTIPTILVDRVDRVSIGGAPVYGTDAIAGTINLILKRRVTGLDVSATSGITEEGDNFRVNISALGGVDFAGGRGNITAMVGYDRADGVTYNDRWFLAANVINTTNPTTAAAAALGPLGRTVLNDGRINPTIGFNDSTTDSFPGTILVANLTRPALSTNGVIASGAGAYNWQFSPGGNIVAYNRGIAYVAPVTASPANARASGGDGFKLNDYNQIVAGVKRLNAGLYATFDLTDRARFYVDATWAHSDARQMAAQPTLNATISTGRSGALTFSVTNPFLTDQARQQLATLGYTNTFTLSRANTDLTDPTGHTISDVYRGVLGFEGKFGLLGRDYTVEAYANFSRSDVADYVQDIDQQKFINAINVAKVGNDIVCTTATSVGGTPIADAACQPLNLFGSGSASAAALSYIQRMTVTRSRLEQFVANVNVGGAPFDLNGNPVSFNLGAEHHREYARFLPDSFIQQGLGRFATTSTTPVSGKFHLNELFGEVLVPLVTPDNGWAISKLEAFGRLRHVDSSFANGNFNAWSFGGAFAPVRDVEFRGNVTRSFRAPSITELYYLRTSSSTATVPELCSNSTINAGSAPAVRAANCAALFAKYPTLNTVSNPLPAAVTAATYAGGNPNLRNERADSFTYGVILRPSFVPGLSVAVDYVNIKIKDPIAFQSIAVIASGCFDNPTFNSADPANGNVYCSLIQRNADGTVVNNASAPGVTTGYVNGQRITMDAIQASANYATRLDRLGVGGSLLLGADLFFLRNRLVDITGVAPTQSEGLVGDPKFQGQFRIAYAAPSWGLSTNVNVTGAQALSYTQRGANPNDTREFDHFDPFATVDSALWFAAAQDFRLTLSVTNLFNRIGQSYYGYYVPGASSTFGSINDPLGRRFAISARKRY